MGKINAAKDRHGIGNHAVDHSFIAVVDEEPGFVNLGGNYDYLSRAYYISQDYENDGKPIKPTCKEMLDAYVPPLFLEKAKKAGLPVPEYYLSNSYFDPPVIVDPVNPFTLKGRTVLKAGHVKTIAKSLTRNFTYAVCCQQIPPGGRVVYFNSILGWAIQAKYREASRRIWECFSIPLARVRLIWTESGEYLFSDISPLFPEDLRERERHHIEENVSWEN
ncbi:MAG: RimK-like ATPgrasp N-terminal domain-containing protein [Candidatus Zixiibacteriota bacterium]